MNAFRTSFFLVSQTSCSSFVGGGGTFNRGCKWLVVVVVFGESERCNQSLDWPRLNKSPNHKIAITKQARADQRSNSLLKTNEGGLGGQDERPAWEGKERCTGSMQQRKVVRYAVKSVLCFQRAMPRLFEQGCHSNDGDSRNGSHGHLNIYFLIAKQK